MMIVMMIMMMTMKILDDNIGFHSIMISIASYVLFFLKYDDDGDDGYDDVDNGDSGGGGGNG